LFSCQYCCSNKRGLSKSNTQLPHAEQKHSHYWPKEAQLMTRLSLQITYISSTQIQQRIKEIITIGQETSGEIYLEGRATLHT